MTAPNGDEKLKKSKSEFYFKNKEKINFKSKKYYLENSEKIKAKSKEYYNNKLDYIKKYNQTPERKLKQNERAKRYYDNHTEDVKKKALKYAKDHPELFRARNAKREAQKRLRFPKWASGIMIEFIYKMCSEGYDVDHIIPLQGKNISGLHVPWNLQYLLSKDNRQKSNKFDGTYENLGWKNEKRNKKN